MQKGDELDPKGLIFEAYRIDGISAPECRTIFLDWALSVPGTHVPADLIAALLRQYAVDFPDHPMTQTLTEGLERIGQPRRRGGWRSRARDA
ncbi:hypothetical protein [Tateyamaria omphalii]|uniref:Uncharacterized protein n=1 Tax=Tateyamaria omphalii TaxID=299262 RepID=A0A1P8MTI1_9RHOB|nr:hypothetical protein [Tateyamaria omphalii]APX11269.1 hypothetical protein BWR18_05910 [Tateyamaria omphalii]